MCDINELKRKQRQDSHLVRCQSFSKETEKLGTDNLYHFFDKFKPPLMIAGYSPINTEINPLKVLEKLESDGYNLCLPIVKAKATPLCFKSWKFGEELVKGKYNVKIPKKGNWVVPDIVITPLLAFDHRGYRLGYGGGYYDRTIAMLKARGKLVVVGFAFAEQEIQSVPTNDTDHKLDAIITQKGMYKLTN